MIHIVTGIKGAVGKTFISLLLFLSYRKYLDDTKQNNKICCLDMNELNNDLAKILLRIDYGQRIVPEKLNKNLMNNYNLVNWKVSIEENSLLDLFYLQPDIKNKKNWEYIAKISEFYSKNDIIIIDTNSSLHNIIGEIERYIQKKNTKQMGSIKEIAEKHPIYIWNILARQFYGAAYNSEWGEYDLTRSQSEETYKGQILNNNYNIKINVQHVITHEILEGNSLTALRDIYNNIKYCDKTINTYALRDLIKNSIRPGSRKVNLNDFLENLKREFDGFIPKNIIFWLFEKSFRNINANDNNIAPLFDEKGDYQKGSLCFYDTDAYYDLLQLSTATMPFKDLYNLFRVLINANDLYFNLIDDYMIPIIEKIII